MNLLKGIVFLCFFYVLFSCERGPKSAVHESDIALSEKEPSSGWYQFPYKLNLDSGEMFVGVSSKNKLGYYDGKIEFTKFNGSLNNLYKTSFANNSLFMRANFNHKSDIVKWKEPTLANIKVGEPVYLRNYDERIWDQRVFFDLSKKLDDDLLTVSLTIDPNDFFNYNSGIYVQGALIDSTNVSKGNYAIRGKGSEKQSFLHVFNSNGDLRFKTGVGIKIHGNLSRAQPQKSFKLSLKKKFGSKPIITSLFGTDQLVNTLILRSPFTSSMHGQSVISDVFISDIALDLGLDAMKSRPCHVYLNGEYWGLYHLREKMDKYYFKEKYKIPKNSIDIIEFDREAENNFIASEGEVKEWVALMDYVENNDVSEKVHFNYISGKLDIENLIDYLILETFFANKDWPGNNYRAWKSKDLDNKWRFIVYDFDASFRNDDMFKYIMDKNLKSGIQISSSSLLFRNLLRNREFVSLYIKRFEKLQEKELKPSTLKRNLKDFYESVSPTMNYQIQRWHIPESSLVWKKRILKMSKYFDKRVIDYDRHLETVTQN